MAVLLDGKRRGWKGNDISLVEWSGCVLAQSFVIDQGTVVALVDKGLRMC